MVRIVCACDKGRFLCEDVEKGKVPCRCGDLNEIDNFKAVTHYPNKQSESFQNRMLLNRKAQ